MGQGQLLLQPGGQGLELGIGGLGLGKKPGIFNSNRGMIGQPVMDWVRYPCPTCGGGGVVEAQQGAGGDMGCESQPLSPSPSRDGASASAAAPVLVMGKVLTLVSGKDRRTYPLPSDVPLRDAYEFDGRTWVVTDVYEAEVSRA